MVGTLIESIFEQINDSRKHAGGLLDTHSKRAHDSMTEARSHLVEALVEEKWLEAVFAGQKTPTYSKLYERYGRLQVFEKLAEPERVEMLKLYKSITNRCRDAVRDIEEYLEILYLFKQSIVTFATVSDSYPPVAGYISAARNLSKQSQSVCDYLRFREDLIHPSTYEELTKALEVRSKAQEAAKDLFEKEIVDSLKMLQKRLLAYGGIRRTEKAIDEEDLRRLLANMDSLQANRQNSLSLIKTWRNRSEWISLKHKNEEMAAQAASRQLVYERSARLIETCLEITKQTVDLVKTGAAESGAE